MTMARRSIFRAFWDGTTAADRRAAVRGRRRAWVVASSLLVSAGIPTLPPPATAQAVRSLPSNNERALRDARERLMRDPADIAALRDATQAAMRLGDVDTAASYAKRAQQLAPGDPVITAARGAVEIHRGRPREGLLLFGQADQMGAPTEAFMADRALGYDLVGDQPSAQYYYALATRATHDDEVLRRYALSLAIVGDYATGDAMLRPLLNVQDRAAWRMHAFMLAIDGRASEAQGVLERILPQEMAAELAPYMIAMPTLSRAQQAAAANLGLFPSLQGANTGAAGREPRRRPEAAPQPGTDFGRR